MQRLQCVRAAAAEDVAHHRLHQLVLQRSVSEANRGATHDTQLIALPKGSGVCGRKAKLTDNLNRTGLSRHDNTIWLSVAPPAVANACGTDYVVD